MPNRWRVIKRGGEWRVMDGDSWHDRFPTLPEAHTAATQYAVAQEVFAPGGLTDIKTIVNWVATRIGSSRAKPNRATGNACGHFSCHQEGEQCCE